MRISECSSDVFPSDLILDTLERRPPRAVFRATAALTTPVTASYRSPWHLQPLEQQDFQGTRMRVLAMASQKGGSGKTTLSGHLAVQAQLAGAGPVVLIDIDQIGRAHV